MKTIRTTRLYDSDLRLIEKIIALSALFSLAASRKYKLKATRPMTSGGSSMTKPAKQIPNISALMARAHGSFISFQRGSVHLATQDESAITR